jgi:hypothetical protein
MLLDFFICVVLVSSYMHVSTMRVLRLHVVFDVVVFECVSVEKERPGRAELSTDWKFHTAIARVVCDAETY